MLVPEPNNKAGKDVLVRFIGSATQKRVPCHCIRKLNLADTILYKPTLQSISNLKAQPCALPSCWECGDQHILNSNWILCANIKCTETLNFNCCSSINPNSNVQDQICSLLESTDIITHSLQCRQQVLSALPHFQTFNETSRVCCILAFVEYV